MKDLYVDNANEVASPKHLMFFVGGPLEMQIFSGIAIPNWDSQLDFDSEQVRVHLGVPAPEDWDYTATISLSSISSSNNGFTFSMDNCIVDTDEIGNLTLSANITVQGEPAYLQSFSYHVEVLSNKKVQGSIFGTIRWSEVFGGPAAPGGAPMFSIGPATYNPVSGSGGTVGWTWDPKYTVSTSVAPLKSAGEWAVPYNIIGLPLNVAFTIVPQLIAGALDGPPFPYRGSPGFFPVSALITLTESTPSAIQDFDMIFTMPPA
jgi:hypothetical protein